MIRMTSNHNCENQCDNQCGDQCGNCKERIDELVNRLQEQIQRCINHVDTGQRGPPGPVGPLLKQSCIPIHTNTFLTQTDGCVFIESSVTSPSVTMMSSPMDGDTIHFCNQGSLSSNVTDTETSSYILNTTGSELSLAWDGSTWTVCTDDNLTMNLNSLVNTLMGEDANGSFGLGVSISSDGSRIVVGAPNENNDMGLVYIYQRTGSFWTPETVLSSPTMESGLYGFSVSINADGSIVIIGAPNENSNAGRAYVYSRSETEWSNVATLSSTPLASGNFGSAVSINSDGSRVIVGAPNENTFVGNAYIFVNDGSWNQEQVVNSVTGNHFGLAVDINTDGSRVIVGSPEENPIDGRVYIYRRDNTTWSLETILTPTPGTDGFFGGSVAIDASGSRIIIGAPARDNDSFTDDGAVFIYTRSGKIWTQEEFITSNNQIDSGQFGASVDINADGLRIIIGELRLGEAGRVYTYHRTNSTWYLEQTLESPEPVINIFSIVSINADGSRCIVGAPFENSQGRAYTFN